MSAIDVSVLSAFQIIFGTVWNFSHAQNQECEYKLYVLE